MDTVVNPLKEFAKNSVRLVKRCTKPDRRGACSLKLCNHSECFARRLAVPSFSHLVAEFNKITIRTAIGFVVMGFIGFFVKLIFIVSLNSLRTIINTTMYARLAESFVVLAAHQPDYCWRERIIINEPVRYSNGQVLNELQSLQFYMPC